MGNYAMDIVSHGVVWTTVDAGQGRYAFITHVLPHAQTTANVTARHVMKEVASTTLHARTIVNAMVNYAWDIVSHGVVLTTVDARQGRYAFITHVLPLSHAQTTANVTARHVMKEVASTTLHARTIANAMGNYAQEDFAHPGRALVTVHV
jgi:hypothetical protein